MNQVKVRVGQVWRAPAFPDEGIPSQRIFLFSFDDGFFYGNVLEEDRLEDDLDGLTEIWEKTIHEEGWELVQEALEFSEEEYLNFVLGLFLQAKQGVPGIPDDWAFARWIMDYMGDIDLLEDILPPEKYMLVKLQMECSWPPEDIQRIEEQMQVEFFGSVVAE